MSVCALVLSVLFLLFLFFFNDTATTEIYTLSLHDALPIYIIPFELAGVRSGALTSGHRRLGAREIAVTTADYEQRLGDHGVVLSAEERRNRIRAGLAGIRIKPDDKLLETLVYLTECPMPIQGSFD